MVNTAIQNTIAPTKKLISASARNEGFCTIQTYGSGRCQKMNGAQNKNHAEIGWNIILPMRLSESDRRCDTPGSGRNEQKRRDDCEQQVLEHMHGNQNDAELIEPNGTDRRRNAGTEEHRAPEPGVGFAHTHMGTTSNGTMS